MPLTRRLLPFALLSLCVAGCEAPPPPAPAAPEASSSGGLSEAEIAAAVADLRQAMQREVPGLIEVSADDETQWEGHVRALLAASGVTIDRPELIFSVDRNSAVQQARVLMVRPGGPWQLIGATTVSTGEEGVRGHWETPVGVFAHTAHILDYRARGTYNRQHLRGLGEKGMRVWDFGWQSTADWREPGSSTRIRLEIHATDPATLAQRLGSPASKGCVHVSAALNGFLDRYGVLDADYEERARIDGRYREVLRRDRTPSVLAGTLMAVFDSSPPALALWEAIKKEVFFF